MVYDPALRSGRNYLLTKPSRSDMAIVVAAGAITVFLMISGIVMFPPNVYFATLIISVLVSLAIVLNTGLRTKAWLEGTTLTVRGAYTSRRCDLARAAVRLDTDPVSGMPLLTAQDAAGQSVRLVLREQRRREALAPQKLNALANAIMSGERRDEAGCEVASSLRSLAGGAAVTPPPCR